MKSLGRIGYEAHEEHNEEIPNHYTSWIFITQAERDAWNTAAEAIVDEYKRRNNPPDEEE